MLGAGALGRPRGMEWGGRREEGSGWGTHVPFPVQYLGIPMPLTLPYRNHSELPPKSMFIFWALEISCGTEQADAWPGKGGKDPGGLKVLRLT